MLILPLLSVEVPNLRHRREQGHLDTYRFCDDVWTFLIQNVTFKLENASVDADKVRIVSCSSKRPGDA